MNIKNLDFRIIGIIFLIVGICIFIAGDCNSIIMGICMAIVMIGMVISIIGIIIMLQNQRIKDRRLEKDVETIIQPLITKYSKINKELIRTQTKENMDTYIAQRHKMNKEIEEELTKRIPYLSKREIKNIVIAFNRDQDSL